METCDPKQRSEITNYYKDYVCEILTVKIHKFHGALLAMLAWPRPWRERGVMMRYQQVKDTQKDEEGGVPSWCREVRIEAVIVQ